MSGTEVLHITASDAKRGDVWLGNGDVAIDAIEAITDDLGARVRITGRIVRGRGRSAKVHTWTVWSDQAMDVLR